MQFIGLALTVYSFAIFLRILLTWFPGNEFGQIGAFLGRITDPYINWFRRLSFLNIGGVDLSIIASLITLWIARSIVANIALTGSLTFGTLLAIIISAIASALFFFLTLFLILAGIRLLGELFGVNTGGRFWLVLDQILEPMVYRLSNALLKGRSVSYQNGLLLFAGVDLVAILFGRFLVGLLVSLLQSLPF